MKIPFNEMDPFTTIKRRYGLNSNEQNQVHSVLSQPKIQIDQFPIRVSCHATERTRERLLEMRVYKTIE